MTKVIYWRSLKEKIAQKLTEIKNKNFEVLLGQITNTINTVKFLVCAIFQLNNDLAVII